MAHPEPVRREVAGSLVPRPRMYDVIVSRLAAVDELDLPPEHPEAMVLSRAPKIVGRMRGRQLDRYLRPLLHPRRLPLLGFCGPATPFWTIDHDRPSVALITPERGPVVRTTSTGVRCCFGWQGRTNEIPLDDPRVTSRLDWFPENPVQGNMLANVLGFRPTLVLVTLSAPVGGYCYKVASALLPR